MIFLERHSDGDDLPAVTSYSVMEEFFLWWHFDEISSFSGNVKGED
jgi:hypothetical protein